jgi:hypothetical protein
MNTESIDAQGVEVFVFDTSKGTRETRFIKPRSLAIAKQAMKDKLSNSQDVATPSVYGVAKVWKQITNHYHDMEIEIIGLMRNPDSKQSDLVEAHKYYLSATLALREMRDRLNNIYGHKFYFTTHGYERK